MDTPNSKSTPSNNNNKLINLPSSESPAFQDSPVFSYLSNLSPIQPVKAAPVAQGFPGLSSPPLIFTSPRLSFINRHLRSSASNLECLRDNDQCQKNDADLADSAKLDLCLQSPTVSIDQKGYNTKKLEQVAPSSSSGCLDEFLTDPKECSNSLCKILSDDVLQSSEVGCLEKRDYGNDRDVVRDDSTSLKISESGQAKSKISIKVVKNEPQHLISASSECSSISTKLPIGHTSELCQTGDTEASHLERGSLRRCLFDENQRMYTTNGPGSCNPNEILTRIQEVSNMSSSGTSTNSQTNNPPKPVTGMLVSPSSANNRVSISKPLGIGLHLNSVVYPRSTDSAIGGQQSSEKVVRVKGNNSVLITNRQPAGKVNASSMPSCLVGKATGSSEEVDHKASSVAMSGKPFASDAAEQFSNPIVLKPDDPSAIASDKRKRNSEITEGNEESDLASPKKKRKKPASTIDDDNCKRCNCKKTKCLKLYCDCFAAGFYCGESCSCQGCFNRPEYEDTVMETRQQIESRNPLAFAPKVVQPVTESPATSKEPVNLSTPSSARHKRGCNCKKSMCLKKYCECYQSNVGCSDGCRCEGCKNVYGKREDFSIAREFLIKRIAEATPEGIDKTQEISVFSKNVLNSRAHNSPNVIPVTPALLCSDQKKNAIKSRLPFRRFLKSPESPEMLTSGDNFPNSPRKSPSHSMLLEKSDAETGFANTENKIFSSFEGPVNESESISTGPPSSSKPQDLGNALQPDSYSGGGLPPPRSNLLWRSSPMTPTQVAGSDFVQDFDTGSKHSDVLEDDTPEILKDSATPVESVKVRSPNKKRVSPPHNHLNSPESLRSSRKFVLKAVCGNLDHHSLPKFPSLTPYSTNNAVTKRSEPLDP